MPNAMEYTLRRRLPHLLERLFHGAQATTLISRALNVVKTQPRDVLGDSKPELVQGADRAKSRDVVKSKQSGEGLARNQQILGRLIAEMGQRGILLDLGDQLRVNRQPHFSGDFHYGIPTGLGIRDERLALNEGNALVPQFDQVLEGEFRRPVMIEQYARNTGHGMVARDRRHRQI